jgi:hypothetical protein
MSTHLDTSLKPPGRGDGSDPTAEAQHRASYATAPLAGLLYAAHRDSHGIDWVVVATKNTEHAVTANDVGWAGAAQRVADVPMLAAALTRAAQLETRQRASVALTMLDALAPWSPESDRR